MIGIPYAPSTITDDGIVKTCPICDAQVLEPFDEFDTEGESIGKDDPSPTPTPYQLHCMVYHPGA